MKRRLVRGFTHFIRLPMNLLTIQVLQRARRTVYSFTRRQLSQRFACHFV